MALFDSIYFHGTYRSYQQRIIDRFSTWNDKHKIHIVAAPGSGKTTLGIELIIRLDRPCLILVPSITIREQWLQRFKDDFLDDKTKMNYFISNDIKKPALITCITYQALYSAYKKEKEIEEDNTLQDYTSFCLQDVLKELNINTICLDECHHLRNEWWKVIENVVKKIENVTTISLTATPPYDASSIEWKRYTNLCGPIDEEIYVPELLKENNLCFHHDLVYLNPLTDKEDLVIKKFLTNANKVYKKYEHNQTLLKIVMENNAYKKYKIFKQQYYYNASYYRALILFLNHNKIKISPSIKQQCNIEPFNISHMEILLQNLLFDDLKKYQNQDFLNRIKKELIAMRLINDGKVNLIFDERHSKLFAESQNKLNSVVEIVKNEYNTLKDNLRLLVLADYIKKETKTSINNNEKTIDSIGILPIFETLRRQELPINICLLSGSLIIVNKNAVEEIKNNLVEKSGIHFKEINKSNYFEIQNFYSHQKEIVKIMTRLFEKGIFNVVVGTRALLGEGWDVPFVNSLIIASNNSSYTTSNQIRGRAIRKDLNNPDKVSTIWHLASVSCTNLTVNPDLDILDKRFDGFLGLDLDENTIENGIERITKNQNFNNENSIQNHNMKMLNDASNRSLIKQKWLLCLESAKHIETVQNELVLDKRCFNRSFSFYNALVQVALIVFLGVNAYSTASLLSLKKFFPLLFYILVIVVLSSYFVFLMLRITRLLNRKQKCYYLANTLLDALKDINVVKSENIDIKVRKRANKMGIYLENATTYEENVFIDSFVQLFEYPDTVRYMLCRPKIFFEEYYIVPDLFKKNKELATIFEKRMSHAFGKHTLYFTKSKQFKGIILQTKARYQIKFPKFIIEKKKSIRIKKRKLKKLQNSL